MRAEFTDEGWLETERTTRIPSGDQSGTGRTEFGTNNGRIIGISISTSAELGVEKSNTHIREIHGI